MIDRFTVDTMGQFILANASEYAMIVLFDENGLEYRRSSICKPLFSDNPDQFVYAELRALAEFGDTEEELLALLSAGWVILIITGAAPWVDIIIILGPLAKALSAKGCELVVIDGRRSDPDVKCADAIDVAFHNLENVTMIRCPSVPGSLRKGEVSILLQGGKNYLRDFAKTWNATTFSCFDPTTSTDESAIRIWAIITETGMHSNLLNEDRLEVLAVIAKLMQTIPHLKDVLFDVRGAKDLMWDNGLAKYNRDTFGQPPSGVNYSVRFCVKTMTIQKVHRALTANRVSFMGKSALLKSLKDDIERGYGSCVADFNSSGETCNYNRPLDVITGSAITATPSPFSSSPLHL